ncbi:hypothetical protein HYV74_04575 [Candidatus Uhrbacteria bacterium]|nr:hypothetical protein [Candidatus Uhrbacteria bacterium]
MSPTSPPAATVCLVAMYDRNHPDAPQRQTKCATRADETAAIQSLLAAWLQEHGPKDLDPQFSTLNSLGVVMLSVPPKLVTTLRDAFPVLLIANGDTRMELIR